MPGMTYYRPRRESVKNDAVGTKEMEDKMRDSNQSQELKQSKEPWYKKQAKDPTGVSGTGCGGAILGAILLVIIVVFAWAAV